MFKDRGKLKGGMYKINNLDFVIKLHSDMLDFERKNGRPPSALDIVKTYGYSYRANVTWHYKNMRSLGVLSFDTDDISGTLVIVYKGDLEKLIRLLYKDEGYLVFNSICYLNYAKFDSWLTLKRVNIIEVGNKHYAVGSFVDKVLNKRIKRPVYPWYGNEINESIPYWERTFVDVGEMKKLGYSEEEFQEALALQKQYYEDVMASALNIKPFGVSKIRSRDEYKK